MQVSGFSFVRNGIKLGYPIKEAIASILPICDEFVIAIGKSEDDTLEQVQSIQDSRIKIIETDWDEKHFVHGKVNAVQSNIALNECEGDWCFYVQADEVIHEKYLPIVMERMKNLLDNEDVQGLLFDYLHFWGSFDYFQKSRRWYRREVRVIRNKIGIESWKSAQSFRLNGEKLRVAHSNASVYHYGWVRPPKVMKDKQIALDSVHHDKEWVKKKHEGTATSFDYGDPRYLARFTDTHPKIMEERIALYNWDFNSGNKAGHPHEKIFDRARTFFEDRVLHYRIGEYKNYILLNNK